MKKTVISAVLLASIALAGCSTGTPAETTAPAETTTTAATQASEESKDTEATEASEDTSASEESKAPDSNVDAKYDQYKNVTDWIKAMYDTKQPADPVEMGDFTGILEAVNIDENPQDVLRYALLDIDNDGQEELFVLSDVRNTDAEGMVIHDINILAVFTRNGDNDFSCITSGWARNRLLLLKDGQFYRRGSSSSDTVVIEFQKYDPAKQIVTSTECYYTNGLKDSDGTPIMFKAKDPAAPAFDDSDENVGPYEEFQLADDIVNFDDSISFADFYGLN